MLPVLMLSPPLPHQPSGGHCCLLWRRYLLRLGMGEQELATEEEFSRVGRVNAMLARRLALLAEVGVCASGVRLEKPEHVAHWIGFHAAKLDFSCLVQHLLLRTSI